MPKTLAPHSAFVWSPEIPVKLKCAIADCITLYAKIESAIVELVWVLENADFTRKQEVAKGWGDQNFRIVKRVVKALPGAESDAIWPALNDLREERNLIGHGVWGMGDRGHPIVIWHRKHLEDVKGVNGELFPWHRFDHFLQRGVVLLATFVEFRNLLRRSEGK